MQKAFLLAVLMSAVLVNPVNATDAVKNYAVWGIGQTSCNQFKQAFDADGTKEYLTYLAGYLTAFSTFSSATDRAPDKTLKQRLHEISEYCTGHRMDSFERGIQATLQANQITSTSAHAPATWGRPPAPTATP